MPGSSRLAAYFLSPLTGGYGEAYSGGDVARQLARTGNKWLIVEGRAKRPVFLEVSDVGVAVHLADEIWSMDTYEAEAAMLAGLADERPERL